MQVLLTGASSFTGLHFARALSATGHTVTATFRGAADRYAGLRAARVAKACEVAAPVWGCAFGDARFCDLLSAERFDVLCHHGAQTRGYRDWDFDWLAAVAADALDLRATLRQFAARGGGRVVLTGSVFEPHEGEAAPDSHGPSHAVSPYGLAKHATWEAFRMEARCAGLDLGKFVIANPFGAWEDGTRFTSYLARSWVAGEVPEVRTPLYLRDNVPVAALARRYAAFAAETGAMRCAPGFYRECQGDFARRCAREAGARLGRTLDLRLAAQTDFAEPMYRANPSAERLVLTPAQEAAEWDGACAAWFGG
jgi:UDP-glucose 4-epimerase